MRISTLTFFLEERNMYPDPNSLVRAGLTAAEIKEVQSCGTRGEIYRLLRLYRCSLLEEIHKKQQSLDTLDYIISKVRDEK